MQPTPKELHDLYSPLLGVVPGLETIDLGNEYAAAMCRVAVEDWLQRRCGADGLNLTLCVWEGVTYTSSYRARVCLVESLGTYDQAMPFEGSGPTIHHALVAAALAVAKARG